MNTKYRWMDDCFQKEKFMSQNLLIVQNSTITKEHFQSPSFFSLLTTLVDFNVGTSDGTTNIQKIFKHCPYVLRHVVSHCRHSIPYVGFQLLKFMVFDQEYKVSHIWDAVSAIQWC